MLKLLFLKDMKGKHKFSRFIRSVLLLLILSSWSLFLNTNHATLKVLNAPNSSDVKARSIILMIGDGMGYEHLKLAKWVEVGKNQSTLLESFPFHRNVTTYSANNPITDSAASATAMATGNKTHNGILSLSPSLELLETIIEISVNLGKSTGIVTTTEITHATPAAFMVHVASRYDTSEITQQIVNNSTVNVLLGGGSNRFSDPQLQELAKSYDIIRNRTKLMEANFSNIFGLFSTGHLPYEISRDPEITPSLRDMTAKTIEILSEDPDGFFLVVEGGRIDHAGHANNKTNVALETIEFIRAIDEAVVFCNQTENVLLIITADHETGGLKILNDNLNNDLPSPENTREENKLLRIERSNNVSVSWSTTSHTSVNVPLFGYGSNFTSINGQDILDNTDIFKIMNNHLTSPSDQNDPDDPYDPYNNNGEMFPIEVGIILGITLGSSLIIVFIYVQLKQRRKVPD